jgi:RNA-directed DNA polymerase
MIDQQPDCCGLQEDNTSDPFTSTLRSKSERGLYKLQSKIYHAELTGDHKWVKTLQKKLIKSHAARSVAIHKITTNKGRNSAGVDGIAKLTQTQKIKLLNTISFKSKPSPTKQVEIEKEHSTDKRILNLPTIHDRVIQKIIQFALDPQIDAMLHKHIFSRKGRSTLDAIHSIRSAIKKPRWLAKADLSKFFDNIDHNQLMKHLKCEGTIKDAINKILKAGTITIDGNRKPTTKGIPQGGPMSSTLANLLLSGIHKHIIHELRKENIIHKKDYKKDHPLIYIYADDILIMHPKKEVVLKALQHLENYMAQWGVSINHEKNIPPTL